MTKAEVTLYDEQGDPTTFTVTLNGYYLQVRQDRKLVFERTTKSEGWLDAKHQKFIDAKKLLEKAVESVVTL